MANNVIILGAGASKLAGIPLMDTFVEKLNSYPLNKVDNNDNPLSESDIETFERAKKVISHLKEYHARGEFDDSNIEDLLSILSFDALHYEMLLLSGELAGGYRSYGDEDEMIWMVEAISRTIDLSCKVKHDGSLDIVQSEGSILYRKFWEGMFEEWSKNKVSPVIITLNYDLVLERSLFQTLITNQRLPSAYPFDGIVINYHSGLYPEFSYKLVEMPKITDLQSDGTALEACQVGDIKNPIVVEILKLHGSLNFPEQLGGSLHGVVPTNTVEFPLIVPPVSNKFIHEQMLPMWEGAREHLRKAKNVIIIGYSLPNTDVYFQFFLKSALGPNLDFAKLIIFNPILFEDSRRANRMKKRYSSCFSKKFRKNIVFRPVLREPNDSYIRPGTFEHFVNLLESNDYNPLY